MKDGNESASRTRGKVPALIFGLAAALSITACGDDDSSGPEETAFGTLVVHLTDAPFPFSLIDSAMVTVDSLRVHYDGSYDGSGSSNGFLTIEAKPQRVNLLDLTNGTTEILASTSVPAGALDQLRVHVSEASVTLVDGRAFELQIPSGEESGIKVFPDEPIPVIGRLTTELIIDFDVSESFKPVPNSPRRAEDITGFQFHPVLRVQVLSEVGTLSGAVWSNAGTADPADDERLEGASVTALLAGIEISTTSTNEQGEYRLMGMPPGSYVLAAAAAGFMADSLETAVEVANDISGNDFRLEPDLGGD